MFPICDISLIDLSVCVIGDIGSCNIDDLRLTDLSVIDSTWHWLAVNCLYSIALSFINLRLVKFLHVLWI